MRSKDDVVVAPDERKAAFIRDLQQLLNKHNAELHITDDGRPYGMHSAVANVTLSEVPYQEFTLPCWMSADPTWVAGE